ncbi:MAG: Crp/Fnr family transcriptional regulator [Paraclostridium sp.]
MENWKLLCESYPFLNELDYDSIQIIKQSLIIKDFDMDFAILNEGEQCLGFSLILKGIIRVYRISEKGKEVTLYKLSKGDTCYLSMSCMLSNKSYPAFAEVVESTKIAFIPNSIFKKYIYDTLGFQKYMVSNLFEKYTEIIKLLEEVAFDRMDSRIAKYLLVTSKETNNSAYIYLTQEKISNDLGTSREVVSRILSDFKNKEIISSSRGKITIINKDKLESISTL